MQGSWFRVGAAVVVGVVAAVSLGSVALRGHGRAVRLPAPAQAAAPAHPGANVAVFAGGCFWGVQEVFEHVKGVKEAVSGYAGGAVASPSYEQVSSGDTGHAESVRVVFDPAVISYQQLLQVFFSVVHDPTQLNRQGPDEGSQYRSAIFYTTDEQRQATQAYIAQLTRAGVFKRPIVTQVAALKSFYPAEAYHQDYALHHPNQPYIVINNAPKVAHLKQQFPELYREYDGSATASAGQ